ncbi:MAG TPA: hypothetical protein VGG33_00530, partial [Polyangia bacterium]
MQVLPVPHIKPSPGFGSNRAHLVLTALLFGTGCGPNIAAEAIAPDRLPTFSADAGREGPDPQHADSGDAGDVVTSIEAIPPIDAAVPATQPPVVDASAPVVRSDAATALDAAVDLPNPLDQRPSSDATLMPPTRPADLTRDRVAHWRLDEQGGTGASDSGPIGNHGSTLGLGDEDWKPGRLHNGLTFKPQQRSFVLVGAHASLSPARALTIAMWMNARSWR